MLTGYTQGTRPITLSTPLGEDVLLLNSFSGQEGISKLYSFKIQVVAENRREIAFDKILGKNTSIKIGMHEGNERHLTGICKRFSQGERDSTFTEYELEIVPRVWLLTKRTQCRIFQQISVPEILKIVFAGYDASYEIQGTFEPRDYCVQYRETDFDFACRLMEEEGIFYFFEHAADGEKMVIANHPSSHRPSPVVSTLIFDTVNGGNRPEGRIDSWKKTQEIRSGKVTLWDHCFELPGQHLNTTAAISQSVQAGKITHSQKVAGNTQLEIYDYPGGYAQRFDGIGPGGDARPADISKIFRDNDRTAKIRIEEETADGLVIRATSDCRHLISGHRFTLTRHFNANGDYLITEIRHDAQSQGYRTDSSDEFAYSATFTCIPYHQPFRPRRETERPFVKGSQTATVVGPPGEEIFTDKYGRVKVQFHWDREGTNDADSSCWIRVSTTWADKGFGFIQIPRVGQEVIVDFLEGDPDQPIITGCVFNAKNMPPFSLPGKKMISGFKSNSYPGGGGNNEISLDDTKGAERMFLNAQYNQDTVVGNNRTAKVLVDSAEEVGNNLQQKVGNDLSEQVTNNKMVVVGVDETTQIGGNQSVSVGKNIVLQAGVSITLQCGAATILMNQAGIISITGTLITMAGSIMTNVAAPITTVSGLVVTSTGAAMNITTGGVLNQQLGGVTNINGGSVNINC